VGHCNSGVYLSYVFVALKRAVLIEALQAPQSLGYAFCKCGFDSIPQMHAIPGVDSRVVHQHRTVDPHLLCMQIQQDLVQPLPQLVVVSLVPWKQGAELDSSDTLASAFMMDPHHGMHQLMIVQTEHVVFSDLNEDAIEPGKMGALQKLV